MTSSCLSPANLLPSLLDHSRSPEKRFSAPLMISPLFLAIQMLTKILTVARPDSTWQMLTAQAKSSSPVCVTFLLFARFKDWNLFFCLAKLQTAVMSHRLNHRTVTTVPETYFNLPQLLTALQRSFVIFGIFQNWNLNLNFKFKLKV